MKLQLTRIFHRGVMFVLLCGAILSLGSTYGRAQMSLPPPQDKQSFPIRKDSLWDGFNVVVIDPGHGGEDKGAVGPEGLLEKDFTLNLARKVENMLVDRIGLTVYLTRDKDISVPLSTRTALSNYRNADLLISLHTGAGFGRDPSGTVVCFYLQDTSAKMQYPVTASSDSLSTWKWEAAHRTHMRESAEFAKILAREVGPLFKGEALEVPEGLIQVLEGASMPAILMEVGAITSPSDEALLHREDTPTALAAAITEAVSIFKRRVEESILKPKSQ